jgi:threonine/homoserine/homoserine lactone efflux protein
MNFLLKGFLIGLAIAAPVGPIGVLCIRRTLADGRWIGFLSGLGAATADMLYASAAAFGLTAVQAVLIRQELWIHWVCGLFLIYLGIRTFFTIPEDRTGPPAHAGAWWRAYLSTLGLTMTNPATILSFAGAFFVLRLGQTGSSQALAGWLVCGVFLGSGTWWLSLSSAVDLLRRKFTAGSLVWVNRGAGIIIAGFGAAALIFL